MKTLDLYIGGTVSFSILISSTGLVGLLSVLTFLEELSDLNERYNALLATKYIAYSMPRIFYDTLPYAILLGCLSGLGMLANSSQLIVMRSFGMSTWEITWCAAKPALAIVFFGLLLGETALPELEKKARVIKESGAQEGITSSNGFWFKEDDTYVRLGKVFSDGRLKDINLILEKNGKVVETVWAEKATYDYRRDKWSLFNVKTTKIGYQTEATTQKSVDWETAVTPSQLNTEILVDPSRMSIRELQQKISFLKDEGLEFGKFEVGFWTKIFQPLASLALVLVGVSFVFGPLRQTNIGTRLVAGITFSICFKFFQDFFGPASLVFNFSPLIAAALPILFSAALGWHLLRKAG
ncbi:LPS export ABC transporter permease LptG [Gammaproteobacteria bacterium]|nr:LPS export ABC transporter permease LptG [Gammaproteobacteria bacterium]